MIDGKNLSLIDKIIEDGEEKLLTAHAIANVLAEAQMYLDENDSAFTGNTVFYVVNAICKYQREAEEIFADVHKKISTLKTMENTERS